MGYSTNQDGTGTGLGLTIVEEHGWEVSIEVSEDGGARFEVRGVEFQ